MQSSGSACASSGDLTLILATIVPRVVRHCYLVVDSYDFYDESMKPLLEIISTQLKGEGVAKAIFVGNFKPNIPNVNNSLAFEISPSLVLGDIGSVLQSLLKDLTAPLSWRECQQVGDLFSQGHNGSFLWCRVVAKHLANRASPTTLVGDLRGLVGKSIFDLYYLIFSDLANQQDKTKQDIAVQTLELLAVAQRPLDIMDFSTALSISVESPPGEAFTNNRLSIVLEQILQSTIGPLLDIRHSAWHGGISSVFSITINLIHPTVSDFIFTPLPNTISVGLPLDRARLHINAARICLRYLSRSEFGIQGHIPRFQRGRDSGAWGATNENEGFMAYAAVHVFQHLVYSGITGAKDLELLQDLQYFTSSSKQVQVWFGFINAHSPMAMMISRGQFEGTRRDLDVWHPGMGNALVKWIETVDRIEIRELFLRWWSDLKREVGG